ncbi:MAG TPA: aspartate carbamoyltransferase regulatory subunit [Bacteroidales bacterium]|nr:aspartate carbamoyltransferase regulatory subunit [Bacteroidota bacterium]HNQ59766.1 aspartate carbamoyltransferase regulatory subunit [Bacteroidales bacterium]HNU21798.1 aspartate carbamoyltransferase regulatory subunit [Bacteroidales bacterium]HNV16506.1 aspartate carbamoyltransferase regulatory subunit [Bacteroidales bacterium]HNZ79054.1 aspartate carbamoyltransferase regulatory subunit [Bacteroidales bacterium]
MIFIFILTHMKPESRKKLIVSAIQNGTVIDHIPSHAVIQVMRILNLIQTDHQVLFGMNLDSKKYGNKGIIKIRDKFFDDVEINKIALVAPTATLIEIRDFEVISKKQAEIPDIVEGIVKCFNPKCITNYEQVRTRFRVIDKQNLRLLCHYCEKITKNENIEFI